MCNLLGQPSLWHLSVLWLFLRAGKPGLHCTQDLCVCTYPSIPRITGGTDLQTPLLLCSVLRGFLRNGRYPETPLFITAPKPSGTAADRGVPSTRCIHVPFAAFLESVIPIPDAAVKISLADVLWCTSSCHLSALELLSSLKLPRRRLDSD